jgi:hypothetical protein
MYFHHQHRCFSHRNIVTTATVSQSLGNCRGQRVHRSTRRRMSSNGRILGVDCGLMRDRARHALASIAVAKHCIRLEFLDLSDSGTSVAASASATSFLRSLDLENTGVTQVGLHPSIGKGWKQRAPIGIGYTSEGQYQARGGTDAGV